LIFDCRFLIDRDHRKPKSATARSANQKSLIENPQAGDGARTHNSQLGRLALCQLSYTRDRKDEGGRMKDEKSRSSGI
jgi:hypothetical protein